MLNLRSARKAKGLTLKKLGAIVGVSESAMSQYETEKREMDYETLRKVSETLGCSIDYLLGVDSLEDTGDPFSDRFRERTRFELSVVDPLDMKAAIESGFQINEIESILDVDRPLYFADACNIALMMGMTVSELLGEDEDDYYESIKDSPFNMLSLSAKKSLGTDQSAPRDAREREIMDLVYGLDGSQKDFLIALLERVTTRSQERLPAAQVSDGE